MQQAIALLLHVFLFPVVVGRRVVGAHQEAEGLLCPDGPERTPVAQMAHQVSESPVEQEYVVT